MKNELREFAYNVIMLSYSIGYWKHSIEVNEIATPVVTYFLSISLIKLWSSVDNFIF